MAKAVLLMMLWLTVMATVCRSSNEVEKGVVNVKEKVSEAAENVKINAEESLNDAKEKSGGWADWATTKVASGLGLDQNEVKEGAHSAVGKASEAASKSTSALNSAASESSKYVSEKTGEVGSLASEKADDGSAKAIDAYNYISELAQEAIKKAQAFAGVVEETTEQQGNYAYDSVASGAGKAITVGSDIAQNTKDYTSDKANQVIQMPTDAGSDIKEKLQGVMVDGKNKAQDAYSSAKDSVQSSDAYGKAAEKAGEAKDALEGGKDSAKEKAKETYEAAKEKASDAAGDVGEAMRT